MSDKKKIISKIIGFFVIVLIFYFLGKNLFTNFEQIREYQFSLNYFYLALSFIFLGLGFLNRGLVWKKIINLLQPDNNLSYLEAIKIETYAELGKYLPGKVFSLIGLIYLARDKNISKKNLLLSVIFYSIFFIVAGFILSLFLISFFFAYPVRDLLSLSPSFASVISNGAYSVNLFNFYLIGIFAIIGGLVAVHPRVFQFLIRLVLIKIKSPDSVELSSGLNWPDRLKMIFYCLFTHFLFGLGFFCLINSITYLPLQNLLSIIGVFVLAMIMGFVVFFVPGGLGIREGALVLLLQPFFPLNIAILISLLTRVWTISADVLAAGGFYLSGKFKK